MTCSIPARSSRAVYTGSDITYTRQCSDVQMLALMLRCRAVDWLLLLLQSAHLFWAIWGLIQARFSAIDFDYIDFAHQRLVEYCARKTEFLSLKMP